MRIIGGKAKGRKIVSPAGRKIRPTSDSIKESLFNLLPAMEGVRFLDLFAGTGSVGMEAMSRGAARTVFVERSRICVEIIEEHIRRFGLSCYECLTMTAERAIQVFSRRDECFDIIFMDPPYDEGFVEKTLCQISDTRILAKDGTIAVQHSTRESDVAQLRSMMLINKRRYGDNVLSFWKWR